MFFTSIFKKMGQQQSKDELVYQLVVEGDVEAMKALCQQGAGLEWRDKSGKTSLIVACMDSRLYIMAKTLIDMGANVNAYRPGRHAGTPLHHAAKRGLDETVKLLLQSRANPFVRNDDVQTPLDVARSKGFTNVVRAIENHICYFSGHVREIFGPGFLEALAPQLVSRKIWVVVTPCLLPDSRRPPKLELAVYSTLQDAQPRIVISLWKSKIEEPKFRQSDPTLIIFDQSTKTRFKISSAVEGDKQQLSRLYNACKGIPQMIHTPELNNAGNPPSSTIANEPHGSAGFPNVNAQPSSSTNGWGEEAASSSNHSGWAPSGTSSYSELNNSGWLPEPERKEHNGWGVPHSSRPASGGSSQQIVSKPSIPSAPEIINAPPVSVVSTSQSAPSAPPLPDDISFDGPIHYPEIDMAPIDLSVPAVELPNESSTTDEETKDNSESSCCIICFEYPVEGACIPCGHMAGCMSCLKEIKSKKGVCPVCRTKIDQVIRLYAV